MRKHRFQGFTIQITKEVLKLYLFDLQNSIPPIKPHVPVKITAHNRPLLLKHVQSSVLKERLSHGDQIFIAHNQSCPVAYLFASNKECWVSEIEDYIIVNAGEIYLYDAYTYPEFRGNRIYPALITHAAQHYRNLQYSKAIIFTTINNTASIRSIEKASFSCYQTIHFYNLCGWRIWDYKKRDNYVQSRFSNEI